MHVEKNIQSSKEKGPRIVSYPRNRTLGAGKVRGALDMDNKLGQELQVP